MLTIRKIMQNTAVIHLLQCPHGHAQIQTQICKIYLNLRPPGKVLIVNLGQHKLEAMLELYKGLFLQRKFVCSSSWFSWKIAFL